MTSHPCHLHHPESATGYSKIYIRQGKTAQEVSQCKKTSNKQSSS